MTHRGLAFFTGGIKLVEGEVAQRLEHVEPRLPDGDWPVQQTLGEEGVDAVPDFYMGKVSD